MDSDALKRKMVAAKAALTRIDNERRYQYKMYGLSSKYQYLTEEYNRRLERFNAAKRAWERAN